MASLRRVATRLPCGLFGTVVGTVLGVTPALAKFPDHPVMPIVPWNAVGGTDQTARPLAKTVEQILRQSIVILKELGYPYLGSAQAVIGPVGIEDEIAKAKQFLVK